MILFLSCLQKEQESPNTKPEINEAQCLNIDIVQVVAGIYLWCTVDDTGCVQCWSACADQKQECPELATPVPALQYVYSFVALDDTWLDDVTARPKGCVIDDNQHISCWGGNPEDYPPFSGSFESVDLTEAGGCALTTDRTHLQCWGENVVEIPLQNGLASYSVDYRYWCVIDSQNVLRCGDLWNPGDIHTAEGSFTAVYVGWGIEALSEEEGWVEWSAPASLDVYTQDKRIVDSAAKGVFVCGMCYLDESGFIGCDTRLNATPSFDVPLKTLTCGVIDQGDDGWEHLFCGLTWDGGARCWSESRGTWSIP